MIVPLGEALRFVADCRLHKRAPSEGNGGAEPGLGAAHGADGGPHHRGRIPHRYRLP